METPCRANPVLDTAMFGPIWCPAETGELARCSVKSTNSGGVLVTAASTARGSRLRASAFGSMTEFEGVFEH